ncbi:MAG TPA: GNAT family N-acetyltransferase [Clostridia bacterium]|nr:GNAT family N-acetyltransferase [Clostridia bacterium]
MTSSSQTVREVVLPDAPSIPGLRFRFVADDSDWVAQAELCKAVSLADDDDYAPTPEAFRIDITNQPDIDLARDLLLAEIDGQIVGHAFRNASVRDGYAVHYLFGRVHPEWRRRGLGRAMLHWNERRAREVVAAKPQFGGPDAQFGMWATDTEEGAIRLLESEGYTIRRYAFTMINRHLDRATIVPLPEGLEIRPVTPDQHRAIFDADDEAFKDHFEHRAATEQDFTTLFAHPDLDTSLWQVAWDGDQVAGSVQTWIWKSENEALGLRRGWLESVSVRRPWRRRGVAKALISASLVQLRERGMEEAMLGVDAENPTGALGVYESVGFEVKVRARSYRKLVEA